MDRKSSFVPSSQAPENQACPVAVKSCAGQELVVQLKYVLSNHLPGKLPSCLVAVCALRRRLSIGLAFARLTGTALTDAIPMSVPAGKQSTDAEISAASEPASSAVWLYGRGEAATTAIVGLEVLRRLVSGLHAVIEVRHFCCYQRTERMYVALAVYQAFAVMFVYGDWLFPRGIAGFADRHCLLGADIRAI